MRILSLFFTFSFAFDDVLLLSLLSQSGSDSQTNQMNSLLPLLLRESVGADTLVSLVDDLISGVEELIA